MSVGAASARDLDRLLGVAFRAADAAGEVLRAHFRRPDLKVEYKPDGSPVTPVDREAETVARKVIERLAPGFGFLGEESGAEGPTDARFVVDPLDGTKNFIAGIDVFAVLVAVEIDGESVVGVVNAPARRHLWWAVRGKGARATTGPWLEADAAVPLKVSSTSRLEHAFLLHGGLRHAIDAGLWDAFARTVPRVRRTRGFGDFQGHMLVAEGRADAMFDPWVAYHDVAATRLIVEEAGGVFRARNGAPVGAGFTGAVLSATPALMDALADSLGL